MHSRREQGHVAVFAGQLEPRSVVFTSSLDEVVFSKAPFNTELRTIWSKELKSPERGRGSRQSCSNCCLKSRRESSIRSERTIGGQVTFII